MDRRDDGAQRQLPGVEAQEHVDENQYERGNQGNHRRVAQFSPDLRPYDVEAAHDDGRVHLPQHRLNGCPHLIGRLAIRWRQSDGHVARGAEILHLNVLEARSLKTAAQDLRLCLTRELRLHRNAAREVDAEIQTAREQRTE